MLMLSDLCRFSLSDSQNFKPRLDDLVVDLDAGDYPLVTHLLFKDSAKELLAINWDQVDAVDPAQARFKVTSLTHGQPPTPEFLAQKVLLKRDVMDAMVLDLQNRRATRANDLCLEIQDEQLKLRAADVGIQAIIRRLTGGRIGKRSSQEAYDWKYVEFLRGDPQAVTNGAGYHLRITRLPAGIIAQLSQAIPYLHAAELVTLLPDRLAAKTLELMSLERQLQVFEELDEEKAQRLLCLMSPDAAADLVSRLSSETARAYLEKLPTDSQQPIVDLLRYPEQTIGGIMTNDVVQAVEDWTVAQARERLKERIKEPDFVYFIYVVNADKSGKLRGVVTLRDLVVADEESRLSEIMNPYVTPLEPLKAALDGAYQVLNSHLAALPVIASDGRLLGAVTVDAAIAQIAPPSLQIPRIFS